MSAMHIDFWEAEMKRMMFVVFMMVSILFVAGCGGDSGSSFDGEEIGCDWFAGDNCWKSTLAAASDCLPADGADGILSADGTSCTFEDGTEVIFNNPYDSEALDNDDYLWDFELRSNDSLCLAYREPSGSSMEITTAEGVFSESAIFSMEITCPDGSQYKVSNAMSLMDCEGGLGDLPGTSYSWQENSVSFGLLGGSDGSTSLFWCTR